MKRFFLFSVLFLASFLQAEETLSIIKPDAVKSEHSGDIIALYEKNGLHVSALKMTKLSKEQAEKFYHVHQGRPYFEDLSKFMSSGPLVVMVLSGDQAIKKTREVIGATDPQEAKPGTIRALYGTSKSLNAVHGSDSPETAKEEIEFFFDQEEIFKA